MSLDIWLHHHAHVVEKKKSISNILPNSVVPYPAQKYVTLQKKNAFKVLLYIFNPETSDLKLSALQWDDCYIKCASETMTLNHADDFCTSIVQPGIDINSEQTSLYHFMPICQCQCQQTTRVYPSIHDVSVSKKTTMLTRVSQTPLFPEPGMLTLSEIEWIYKRSKKQQKKKKTWKTTPKQPQKPDRLREGFIFVLFVSVEWCQHLWWGFHHLRMKPNNKEINKQKLLDGKRTEGKSCVFEQLVLLLY